MHSYAQINIQLYNQMRRREYSQSEIVAVHRAYLHSLPLMSGRFRPSGKPLQDHLVGTASILAERHAPLKFLIVAILHAAHEEGDFGDFGAFANLSAAAKRRHLKKILNEESEILLAAYANFSWNTEAILKAEENFRALSETEREVIFLRLANDLEDHLDKAVLHCPNRQERLRYLERCGPAMVKMARCLKQETLATELAHSHAALLEEKDWSKFPLATAHDNSWMAAPLSHRKRVVHAAAPPLLHNAGRVARKIRRVLRGKQ